LKDQIERTGRMRTVWRELPGASQVRQEGGQSSILQDATGGLPRTVPPVIGMPIAMKALGAIAIEQRRKAGRKLLFWVGPGWRVDSHKAPHAFETIVELSIRLREARVEISMANRWLPEHEDQGM